MASLKPKLMDFLCLNQFERICLDIPKTHKHNILKKPFETKAN